MDSSLRSAKVADLAFRMYGITVFTPVPKKRKSKRKKGTK